MITVISDEQEQYLIGYLQFRELTRGQIDWIRERLNDSGSLPADLIRYGTRER